MRLSHVGVTCTHLDRSICFYRDAFGAVLGMRVTRATPWISDIVGAHGSELEFAHMKLPDGTHLELIEYHAPATLGTGPALPWRMGHTHFCIVVQDIESAVAIALYSGASMRSVNIVTIPEGPNTGLRCCYLTGPSGETIELAELPR